MGFFDKFKKKQEDKFDKQIAELQAKNANATVSPEDAAGMMNAFSSFVTDSAETPLAGNTKISFKADGTYEQKKVVKISAEATAAYDAAVALFDERGGWDDEVFELYKKAADLDEPYACEALGEYLMGTDDELSEHYLNKARALGRNC